VLYLNRFVSQVAQALNGSFKPTHLSKFLAFSSFVGHNYSSEKIVREVFNFFTIIIHSSSYNHQLITFKRQDDPDERLTEEEKIHLGQRIDTAFNFVTQYLTDNVGALGAGTQALSRKTIKELAASMRIRPGDTTWEIGCGCPKVSFSFSAAACAGMVIATDTCKVFHLFSTTTSSSCFFDYRPRHFYNSRGTE
jgi:hypothetical protein